MKKYNPQDVIDYYHHSEPHYKMFWNYAESMGLHYGIWEDGTKSLKDAILNTNKLLIGMGKITADCKVLDAGCGVGGTAIYTAKNVGAHVTGITLAPRQILRAQAFAKRDGVEYKTSFLEMNYTATSFPDASFDAVFAIESMQTAQDKEAMFREISRVLKPGGRFLIADVFKSFEYNIDDYPVMGTMINGWAMSDLLTVQQLKDMLAAGSVGKFAYRDVTREIRPSVNKMFGASILGMFGTFFYNLFYNATHFSKTHYKTGLAQYSAYRQGLWQYHLVCAEKA